MPDLTRLGYEYCFDIELTSIAIRTFAEVAVCQHGIFSEVSWNLLIKDLLQV